VSDDKPDDQAKAQETPSGAPPAEGTPSARAEKSLSRGEAAQTNPRGKQEGAAKHTLKDEIREWVQTIVGALAIWAVFSTFFYAIYFIPSESMQPQLEVGDRVAVNKFVYGYSRHSIVLGLGKYLPEGDGRILGRMPKRGEVAVFIAPDGGDTMIKRIVGLPGDRIQMLAGALYINGEPARLSERETLTYESYRARPQTADRYLETLPAGEKTVDGGYFVYDGGGTGADNTRMITVPEGHVFAMGDNRDRSADSRAIGAVPIEHLVGRAETVVFTLHSCEERPGVRCPTGRVWESLVP